MTGKCGTCRFWIHKIDSAWPDLRQCGAVEFVDFDADQPAGKAVVVDGSGYHGALKTREDFACSLYEGK